MATYKLIGQRNLRKYTAPRDNPVYSAAADAQAIVRALCDVPWQTVAVRDAAMTYHTEEVVAKSGDEEISGLDMNVRIRDEFDAALFCAGHSGGMHRAYANAAVYRYAVPDAAQGVSLASLSANVTSDPYNSQGCRLHVWTADSAAIPTSCSDIRGDDSSGAALTDGTVAAAVAKRTEKTVTSGKTTSTYWYPTDETVTLSPTGGLVLKKYLFLAVVLESYSTVRGNWLEGCSFIANSVTVETAAEVSGWTDGATYDLSENADAQTLPVIRGGIVPSVPTGSCTGVRAVAIRADANLLVEANGEQAAARDAAAANAASALSRLYAEFYEANDTPAAATAPTAQTGVVFNFTRVTESHFSADDDTPVKTDVLRLDCRVLVAPIAYPLGFTARTLRLTYAAPSFADGTSVRVYLASGYRTSLDAATLKDPSLYDGRSSAPLTYLGEIDADATQTDLALPASSARAATVVLAAFFPPEKVDLSSFAAQGTGETPFIPEITVLE